MFSKPRYCGAFVIFETSNYYSVKKPILAFLLCIIFIAAQAQYSFKSFNLRAGGSSFPKYLNAIGNKVYFNAQDGVHGEELWVTDGTDTGTRMIADIVPGSGSSQPVYFTPLGTQVVFIATTPGIGYALWITDGTAAGTILLKDIDTSSTSSPFSDMIAYNGKVYFGAHTPATGREMWETDGTTAGTKLLKEIWPGTDAANPTNLTVYNGKLYFMAFSSWATKDYELWESDGTTAGTKIAGPLTATGPGITGGYRPIPILNNEHYFGNISGTNTCLYKSDGRLANKQLVKVINPTQPINIDIKTVAYNKVYFVADDGVHGEELWVSDGTEPGTYMLKDITPPQVPSFQMSTKDCYAFNGKVYFNNNDSVHGEELWVTDGTDTGTHLFIDFFPGTTSSQFTSFITCKGKMYFNARTTNYRDRLYVSDGTVAGTQIVMPLGAQTINSQKHHGYHMAVIDSTIYTEAYYDTTVTELWTITDTTISTPPPNKISNTSFANHITLYPNPAHHNFTIKTTTAFKAGSVTLTDVTGRVVKSEKLNTKFETISLEGIAPGIYMADVWLDDKRHTQKLVIE